MGGKSRPEFYNEEEMAEILRIDVPKLRSRRHCGTNHPPYQKIGRDTLYPKEQVHKWLSGLPVIWEVRRVG
jgi:hypothetical protein